MHHDGDEEAISILKSPNYTTHKTTYSDGLNSIRIHLKEVQQLNKAKISSFLKRNQLVYFLILMLYVVTWVTLVFLFNYSRGKEKDRNKELNRVNGALNQSIGLEENQNDTKGNEKEVIVKYLSFLKKHLPFKRFYVIKKQSNKFSPISQLSYDGLNNFKTGVFLFE